MEISNARVFDIRGAAVFDSGGRGKT